MRTALHIVRVLSLMLLAVLGTSVLMYAAPGYFTNQAEMDAAHADVARMHSSELRREQGTLTALLASEFSTWKHGSLGTSRQFEMPVSDLLRQRCAVTARLLVAGIALGWSVAILVAVVFSLRASSGLDVLVSIATAVCLALPVGVLATVCLVSETGGPISVLASVIAVRDFKFLRRITQSALAAPHILHAQAMGLSGIRILLGHVAPGLRRELFGLGVMSFTLALSAIVPVEVVFDAPGLGQLAWSAAMNRDLPVLVAVTALMAICIGIAGCFESPDKALESASCA